MSFQRKQKSKLQSIFLIETILSEENTLERKYVIMGSTGNIYNVVINNIPTCTCPDFVTRHNRCKHIYFVLNRVMKVDNEDKEIYSETELQDMFNDIPNIMKHLMVNDELKDTYDKLKSNNSVKCNKKDSDDICPICLDNLENGEELDYCKYSCGKQIHKVCYGMWIKKHPATCVFCRAEWNKENNTYINLINK